MIRNRFNKDGFRAQKVFTDRKDYKTVFKDNIKNYRDTKDPRVIVFYGKGGVGKSRLLCELYEMSKDVCKENDIQINSIFVNMAAFDFANSINALMSIRKEIKHDCELFDYAAVLYFSKIKVSVDEVKSKISDIGSTVMSIANDALSLATGNVAIPAAILQSIISKAKDIKFKQNHKDEIEELEKLDVLEIEERLPYYLGCCINDLYEKGIYYMLFVDSYESLIIQHRNDTRCEYEMWLQDLFTSAEHMCFTIASRDILKWDKSDPEWADYLDQHFLGNLSKEDSRWFLEQVPITESDILDMIVDHSEGVPRYLDLCVDMYVKCKNDGTEFTLNASENGEKIINRYMNYLSDKEQYALKILSMLPPFDIEFARELLHKESYSFGGDELRVLFDKSIFVPSGNDDGLIEMDRGVRTHLLDSMDIKRKSEIANSILNCILENAHSEYCRYYCYLIADMIKDPDYDESLSEKMISACDLFTSRGYWPQLHKILTICCDDSNDMLRTIAVFEEALWYRRTGKLQQGIEFMDANFANRELLGDWEYYYRYLYLQNKHLLGKYDEALDGYKKLLDEMRPVRKIIPSHIWNTIAMKYADVLFLKGQFDESREIVNDLLNGDDCSIEDRIELMRIIGHIDRFNGNYDDAYSIYSKALELAKKDNMVAFCGKLYTNMVETCCFISPQDAMEWFKKGEEIFIDTGNLIELGKAQAGLSIAYTSLKDVENAIDYAKQSIETASKTGYLAGKAFGLKALYLAEKEVDSNEAEKVFEELTNLVELIGVYRYIVVR